MLQISTIVFQIENIDTFECVVTDARSVTFNSGPRFPNLDEKYLHIWRSSFHSKIEIRDKQEEYIQGTDPQYIQKDPNFDQEKRSQRSGAIKSTLYTKRLENRLYAAQC